MGYEKNIATASYFKLKIDPDTKLTIGEKREISRDAVSNDVPKIYLDNNRFRRIILRWEKLSILYLAFMHFACTIIIYRKFGLACLII